MGEQMLRGVSAVSCVTIMSPEPFKTMLRAEWSVEWKVVLLILIQSCHNETIHAAN